MLFVFLQFFYDLIYISTFEIKRFLSHAFKGALKTQVLENGSTEKASTKQRISQGWKTQAQKMQVQCKPSVR